MTTAKVTNMESINNTDNLLLSTNNRNGHQKDVAHIVGGNNNTINYIKRIQHDDTHDMNSCYQNEALAVVNQLVFEVSLNDSIMPVEMKTITDTALIETNEPATSITTTRNVDQETNAVSTEKTKDADESALGSSALNQHPAITTSKPTNHTTIKVSQTKLYMKKESSQLEKEEQLNFETSLPDSNPLHIVEGESPSLLPEDDESKSIVTLKNLEVSPRSEANNSSSNTPDLNSDYDHPSSSLLFASTAESQIRKKTSLKRTAQPPTREHSERSKRQRTQTQLFQVPHRVPNSRTKVNNNMFRKTAVATSSRQKIKLEPAHPTPERAPSPKIQPINTSHIEYLQQGAQGVIIYEKDDYVALRNESSSFFLGKTAEKVKVNTPFFKIRWLDTNDTRIYRLTKQYDKVPQKSIIMPVYLTKTKNGASREQIYLLPNDQREAILERLKRSLNAPNESAVETASNITA